MYEGSDGLSVAAAVADYAIVTIAYTGQPIV
jgi:hypothetical protein